MTVVRFISFSLRNLPVRAFGYRAQGFSPPPARRRSSCSPPSSNLVRTHPIENYQALRDCVPCLSRAATLPKGTKLELGRGAHLGTPSSANHTAAASQPTGRIAKAVSWLHLSRVIVPGSAVMREEGATDDSPVDTLYWMRESELKHGRIAQLAVVGWIFVDQGLRFPGDKYSAISLSVDAHDPMVAAGNMTIMLLGVFVLEMLSGVAVFGAATGSGRAPGEFGFDPFNLKDNPDKKARYELSEIQHCRLAMFAIGGIATQAVLNGGTFPYVGN